MYLRLKTTKFISKLIIVFLVCQVMLQNGCTVVNVLKGKTGTDISTITVGISKIEVEEILGAPVGEWTTSSGSHYCIYSYDRGIPPSIGDATAHAFMDVASLGLWEFVFVINPDEEYSDIRLIKEQIAVSYNNDDVVVGVFDHFGDFDELPP